jgi:hypothetical protein
MGVKHGSKLARDDVTTLRTLGSIIEMDASSCGSSKGLNNARKLHPTCSSEGFVEKESSVEVNWKQLSIDFDQHDSSNYEMETYFL